MLPYSIVVDATSENPFRVLRGGHAVFVAGADEMLIENVPEMKLDISRKKVLFDVDDNEYLDGGLLYDYRVWCFDCSRWYAMRSTAFPSSCPSCGCTKVSDVTEEQYALRGYPVSVVVGLTGHHLAQFDNRGKFTTFMMFVQFQNTPEIVPSGITFLNVLMDGMTDLVVVDINKFGFKYRVTSIGPRNTLGTVEFDWEATYG
jgi:hypothetical protein